MPPLLCAPPTILDQSFPRNENELNLVASALGELQSYLEEDEAHLVLTTGLRELAESFNWESASRYSLLREVFSLINQWFLQHHERLVEPNLSSVVSYQPHPIPEGCQDQGLVEFWADELGKLLMLHDDRCERGEFFIGVVCVFAFAGLTKGQYASLGNKRAFPLVGPDDIGQLADAYEWKVPRDTWYKEVTFDNAFRHCRVIGALSVDNPPGGSHYKVRFKGKRPWPLDPNNDPIPERFLRELVEISGLPIQVIKYALINGSLPEAVLRIPDSRRM